VQLQESRTPDEDEGGPSRVTGLDYRTFNEDREHRSRIEDQNGQVPPETNEGKCPLDELEGLNADSAEVQIQFADESQRVKHMLRGKIIARSLLLKAKTQKLLKI
jgi:hypothetical protein